MNFLEELDFFFRNNHLRRDDIAYISVGDKLVFAHDFFECAAKVEYPTHWGDSEWVTADIVIMFLDGSWIDREYDFDTLSDYWTFHLRPTQPREFKRDLKPEDLFFEDEESYDEENDPYALDDEED